MSSNECLGRHLTIEVPALASLYSVVSLSRLFCCRALGDDHTSYSNKLLIEFKCKGLG
ncbi:hypothetical protein CC86DRAFT_366127 [Ophiobolus disseminans]|uniref:Uncharacterized protein n=1 Tax=Ophiobolus disseminans TaxID=1469910 RepID=A0A6A7AG45_9PLEO|nr:hypothetical protein CC86DRAFT_366127 [Ophiobolus disseminans]